MFTYLAYTPLTRPTGRLMAVELGLRSYGVRTPPAPPEALVRWGSRREMGSPEIILNRASAIRLASDKIATLDHLAEAGVPHVPFFRSWAEAFDTAGGRGIILGRTRWGMQGRGISVYDPAQIWGGRYPPRPAARHEWYSIYMEPTREVRLHVVETEVVRIQGKFLDFPEQAERNPFVRNYGTGYRFRAPRRDLHTRRKDAAIEAVQALGLNFGAVDMLLFGDREEARVLEVNTAPACSPLTARAYADALVRALERRSR